MRTHPAEGSWRASWAYIETVVDTMREPVLILDKDLRVLAANETFYRTFQLEPENTQKKIVYELADGQWNIPELRKLLEEILPKNTFFKGFEIAHEFPSIGRKIMILNARQINPIILLALEDVTEMLVLAETLAGHANQLQGRLGDRTQKLEVHIGKLQKEINELKHKV